MLCVLLCSCMSICACACFFFQAEDGIRDLVRSRGLGDVYKRQVIDSDMTMAMGSLVKVFSWYDNESGYSNRLVDLAKIIGACLLYTSDAADERSSVDLGGRRIIKKKKKHNNLIHDNITKTKAT